MDFDRRCALLGNPLQTHVLSTQLKTSVHVQDSQSDAKLEFLEGLGKSTFATFT